MTEVARLLLEGIDEDGVEFRANYDGQSKEPIVLPGGFPNLLANGAQGIAVGMATSIPPHNAAELCDAALHLIDKPEAKSKTLLKWVKGPDFPTGGIIVDSKESIAEAYMTGRGSFRTRARWSAGRGRPRHLGRRHHRNSLAGAEIAAGREDRRTAQRQEAAAGRRCPRRIGRRRPSRDRAEVARGRSGTADGIAVPADRAGKPDSAEPQRAGQGPHPQGARACRVPARMARPSARRAAAPLQLPQGADRASAGSARRLSDRLSQHRQGDQDHPHRGRAEAGADEGVQADGDPGRRHPQHAPAHPCASSRNSKSAPRTRTFAPN